MMVFDVLVPYTSLPLLNIPYTVLVPSVNSEDNITPAVPPLGVGVVLMGAPVATSLMYNCICAVGSVMLLLALIVKVSVVD
jgi:hypothetical protein